MLREVAVAAARRAAAGTLGWPGWASSAAVSCLEQGRHLASSSKGQPDDHNELSTSYNNDLSDLQQSGDFAALPPRVHQLIGDPRTGVADDTTTNPFGSVEVEQIWTQDQQELTWYRYTYGAEHMPNMHRDSRLSDHSKNLMYVLRAKDPRRWAGCHDIPLVARTRPGWRVHLPHSMCSLGPCALHEQVLATQ